MNTGFETFRVNAVVPFPGKGVPKIMNISAGAFFKKFVPMFKQKKVKKFVPLVKEKKLEFIQYDKNGNSIIVTGIFRGNLNVYT